MYHGSLLRIEGAAIGAAALGAYVLLGESYLLLAVLFLAPDLAMLGYLGGRRLGSLTYNAVHTYVGPAAMLAIGIGAGVELALPLGLIWTAHVGLDRAIGYGLKFADAPFGETHLQRLAASQPTDTDATIDPVVTAD
jgi:hypothetical protein